MTGPGVYTQRGGLVCFEGGEGAGKSTQSRLLRTWLESLGHTVVLTFEPGDTAVGAEVRRIVLSPETGALADRTEVLLYAADKAEHVDAVVRPALERGEVVITDRYVDSSIANANSSANNSYVELAGDTMTGKLTISSGGLSVTGASTFNNGVTFAAGLNAGGQLITEIGLDHGHIQQDAEGAAQCLGHRD